MTDTKKKATVLDLDAFRALAPKVFGKFDVAYRVNHIGSSNYGVAYPDAPGPAFYVLSPNTGFSGEKEAFKNATGRDYAYLDPLLGKLLRDAGYVASYMRARGLSRMLEDVEKEVAKHLPEEILDLGRQEAARMAAQARADARKTILAAAEGLKFKLGKLGATAEVEAGTYGGLGLLIESLADAQ